MRQPTTDEEVPVDAPIRVTDYSVLSVRSDHDPTLIDETGLGRWDRYRLPQTVRPHLQSPEAPSLPHDEQPLVFLDREFDIVDVDGRPLFSGYEVGPPNQALRTEALVVAWRWGSADFVFRPVGIDRRHPCCAPRLAQRQWRQPDHRCVEWMVHDYQVDGPQGWHRRVHAPDNTVVSEASMEQLHYASQLMLDPNIGYRVRPGRTVPLPS